MKKILSQGCRVFTLDDGRTVVLGNDGSSGKRRDGNFYGQSKFQRKETEDAVFISMKKQPEEPVRPRTPSLPRVPWIPEAHPNSGRFPSDMTLSGDYKFVYAIDTEPIFHDLPYSNLYAVFGPGAEFKIKFYLDNVFDSEVTVYAGDTNIPDGYWLYGLPPGETQTKIEFWHGFQLLEQYITVFNADGGFYTHEFYY